LIGTFGIYAGLYLTAASVLVEHCLIFVSDCHLCVLSRNVHSGINHF